MDWKPLIGMEDCRTSLETVKVVKGLPPLEMGGMDG